jgi:mannose-binding lectin 2
MRFFVLAIAAFECVLGGLIPQLSFHAPFTDLDSDGKRTVKNWNVQGSAEINKGFVRVTPDRQSKQGFLWGNSPIDADEFTIIFQFRISGQGQRFFGDGIALWITENSHYSGGNLHGASESFKGVGIIMDTFKNTETAALHKDVTIFQNDGTKSVDEMQKVSVGCDASMRYHEKRADFSPTNSSRVKIQYNRGFLKISVDSKTTGTWDACTEIPALNLVPADFTKKAYIAVTASTGALADNHDVIGMSVYSSSDDEEAIMKDSETVWNSKPAYEKHGGDEVATLRDNMDKFKLDLEHQLTSVNDGLKHSFKKLQKQEDDMEKRLEILEQKFKDMVAEQVSNKISDVHSAIQADVHESISQRLADSEVRVASVMQTHVASTMGAVATSGGGWKIPFAILVVFVAILVFFGYQKYQQMMKSHLL